MKARRILLALALAAPVGGRAAPALRVAKAAHDPRSILVRRRDVTATNAPRVRGVRLEPHRTAPIDAPHIRHERFRKFRLPVGVTVEAALAEIARTQPELEAIPDRILYAYRAPDDPMYAQSWGLSNTAQTVNTISPFGMKPGNPGAAGKDIGAEAAWDFQSDCSSVIVAVIDTGVNYNHVDLAPNMWVSTDPSYPNHGYDFFEGDDDPTDLDGHGTHVAAIIGAKGDNTTGVTGVCWSVQIMALRALGPTGQGQLSNVVNAIDFAVAHGAKVINMSLGGAGSDPAMENAIADAEAADVVVVSAAGNDGSDNDATPNVPCNSGGDGSLCVAALTQNFELADFSNYGATSVHVAAPGTNVVSTYNGTVTQISPSMTSGWTIVNNIASPGGWGYAVANGGTLQVLVNPTNLLSSTNGYGANATDHFYRTIDASGADVALFEWLDTIDTQMTDEILVHCKGAGGDPTSSGTQLFSDSFLGGLAINYETVQIPVGCQTSTATFGFQLVSDASGTGRGLAVGDVLVQKTVLDTTSYGVLSGTSQATPFVAGVAALVRAFRPTASAARVVEAIKNGGTPVAALVGKTSSGKAVHALGALSYLAAPKNVTVELQPPSP